MPWPDPVALEGAHATLAPLDHSHLDDLVEATKDGELWKLWYTFVPTAEDMAGEIDRRLGLVAAVVVVAHVEGFDLARVVVHEGSLTVGHLGEPPLVLGGEVGAGSGADGTGGAAAGAAIGASPAS